MEKKALDFKDIFKKAYIFIESRKKMVELAISNIKIDKISDLVDKSAKKTNLEQPFSGLFTLLDSAF